MEDDRKTVAERRKTMAEYRRECSLDNTRPSWPGYIQFLFVVGLVALFILLAVSMQRHHFLDGSLDHRENVADQ
jgi:hypothetical protein